MHRLFVDVLDAAIAWRTGRGYRRHLARFREMDTWSRDRLEAWRRERLARLIHHAYEHVPFWRAALDELGAEPGDLSLPEHMRLLPVMTKQVIRDRAEELVSDVGGEGRVADRATGGSTGRNVWFKVDLGTQDRRRAAGRLTERWDRVVPGTRLATLWGSSLETSPSRGAQLYDRLANRLFLSAYGVDDRDLEEYFRQLERFRPEVVSSYPSILRHVVRRMGRERCRRLGVRLVYCSSEALFPAVREEIEDAFGAAVRNRYASREFGMIASDCPEGTGLHLMDMRLWVEPRERAHGDAPRELLVTDLDNLAMPFIRYNIEDLGVLAGEPCPCGRPWGRLATVEGRSLDVVVTPDGRAFGGTFFTIVLRPFDRSIEQFQVVQDRPDHLRIKIVPGPGYDADRRARVLETLDEQLAPLAIELVEVEEIPPLASGKRRFVVSELEPARPEVAGR